MDERPIGVFDSGIGGLSVLRALLDELPQESFVYVADSGHSPYGERDDEHVLSRSTALAAHLVKAENIKALVVACNTATAAAIHHLRQAYPLLPIVGIEPALKPATLQSATKTVGVMATRGTLNSRKFADLLNSLHGQATFVLQPCDGLADAIDHDDAGKIEACCKMHLRAMGAFGTQPGEMDTIVLGCTHYPFVSETIRALVGSDIALLEGGQPVARRTRALLAERSILCTQEARARVPRFYSTGDKDILNFAAMRWLGLTAQTQFLDGP